MTQSIHALVTESSDSSILSDWQLRFLLTKLGLKRGERILVHGNLNADLATAISRSIGEQGEILLLPPANSPKPAILPPQVKLVTSGPSLESQTCGAILILPECLKEPFYPLLDQAWRRLGNSGRLLLALGKENEENLHDAVDEANRIGFVTRYRRCCDNHCAWVGVKYQRD